MAKTIKSIPSSIKENIISTYDRIAQRNKIEGKIEVVIALHEDGLPFSQIVKYTKRSEDQIVKILKDNGSNE